MVNYCVCAGCTNSSLSGNRVHHFPSRKSKVFRFWVRFVQVKRADFTAGSVTTHSVVCGAHFTPESYRPGDLLESRMGFRSKDHVRLITDAVPSVHSMESSPPPSKLSPEPGAGRTGGPSASMHRKRALSRIHITIKEGRSLPNLKRCNTCCNGFHCLFCSSTLFHPTKLSKVRTHLERHFNRAVLHGGYTIHRCGLACQPKWHYHCIHCQSMLLRKPDFIKHLSLCKEKHPVITPTTPAPATPSTPAPATLTMPTPSGQMQMVRVKSVLQKKFPICQVLINKNSLKCHMERKHTGKHKDITVSSHLQCECMGPENGIYTVYKSFHGDHSIGR